MSRGDEDEGRRLHDWIVDGTYSRTTRQALWMHCELIPTAWRPWVEKFKVVMRWGFAGLLCASIAYFVIVFLAPDERQTLLKASLGLRLGRAGLPFLYVLLACTCGFWLGAATLVVRKQFNAAASFFQPATFLICALTQIWQMPHSSHLQSTTPFAFWPFTLYGLARGTLALVQVWKGSDNRRNKIPRLSASQK